LANREKENQTKEKEKGNSGRLKKRGFHFIQLMIVVV
jgi:hypothetical protein